MSGGKPFVQYFFRPEEKHVGSGGYQIVIPLTKRDEEMDERLCALELSPGHAQVDRLRALGTGGFDPGVCVQGGRDAERVPGAIGEIGLTVRVDLEGSLHARKRVRHQDLVRAGLEVERVAFVKPLVGCASLLVRE